MFAVAWTADRLVERRTAKFSKAPANLVAGVISVSGFGFFFGVFGVSDMDVNAVVFRLVDFDFGVWIVKFESSNRANGLVGVSSMSADFCLANFDLGAIFVGGFAFGSIVKSSKRDLLEDLVFVANFVSLSVEMRRDLLRGWLVEDVDSEDDFLVRRATGAFLLLFKVQTIL